MMLSLTNRIKKKAAELGFSAIGVARAEPLLKEKKHLIEWLARGYNASMNWMERETEKRADPARILPNVKTVISTAVNYFYPGEEFDSPDMGKISRYARGYDYHYVITEKLEQLYKFISDEMPDVNGKVYVDTGPVMEKIWAARAGIGWMGKNSNLITRNYGSWVFLGEILLDCELDYDTPLHGMCGTCTACIDACPTHAIVEPYVVDSNKCISYLTIEHRGELQKEIYSDFQNWVYGCDICQEVCPWNRFQTMTKEESFYPRQDNTNPVLTELAEMSKEEFDRRYQRSSIKRTKHAGLIRNARGVLESGERKK
ncbi:MAG: tRNA epoxyqueuosine(34) reductase QueG [Bacteroidetes bacterium]|nr:tRNA epoxyqueuosine(34) reductase QueG [Bacteroidota bacterium]